MGISRELKEGWIDRDLQFEIKQENAHDINRRLYILDHDTNKRITNKSNKHERNSNKLPK